MSATRSGTDSPFTTRPLTEAGSIKPRSKLVSSPGNVLVPEEFLIWRPCVGKPSPGIAASTAPAPKSTGSLTAKPPAASSATKGNLLSGHRPSGYIRALQATSNFIRDGQDLNFAN